MMNNYYDAHLMTVDVRHCWPSKDISNCFEVLEHLRFLGDDGSLDGKQGNLMFSSIINIIVLV